MKKIDPRTSRGRTLNKNNRTTQFWTVKIGEKEKLIEFQFIPLTLPNTMEVKLDPFVLRNIMDLIKKEENYHLFPDVSTVEPPDEHFVEKDEDIIVILARSMKTPPYGILVLFEGISGTFKIEALWPESFSAACQKTPQLLSAALKTLEEHPKDFLGVSIYSIRSS